MRSATLLLLSTLLACGERTSGPISPVATGLPSEFPPAGQLVDDRTLAGVGTSIDPLAGAISQPAVAPDVPTAPVVEAFAVQTAGGTLMYPGTLWADGAVAIYTNEAVSVDALKAAVELFDAASKEDLVVGRGAPIRFAIENVSSGLVIGDQRGTQFVVRPEKQFASGHWYRLRVAGTLTTASGRALGAMHESYLRGPEPLQVTDVACGWPVCTAEQRWTVSFNANLDPASLAGCMSTTPALDLGPMNVEGWSVVFQPKSPKAGTTYRLKVNERCKSTSGDRLAAPYDKAIKVEAPRARLTLAHGTGYVAPAKDLSIKLGAAHSGRLTVGLTRISRAMLPAFLAANRESWGGLSFDKASVDKSTFIDPPDGDVDVRVPLQAALKDERGLVYLRVEAQRIGYDDEPPVRQALIQVTELGLSVKSGPEETLVWVTSLVDHRPLAGITIEGIDSAGKILWRGTTDERGLATGPGRKEGDDQSAQIVMASRGEDVAFLDLAEYKNRSEPYDFGLPYAWDARADALTGIVFTERGVYRTGETVHVKGYVRVASAAKLERVAYDLRVTVTNPMGDRALERTVSVGPTGDFELDVPLSPSAAYGSWQITAARADGGDDVSGSVNGAFRVEAYRPNTFEVKVDDLERTPDDHLRANAIGRYYYGAPMVDAKARWWVTRADAGFSPSGYEAFTFEVPSWADDDWEPNGRSVATVAEGFGVLDAGGGLAIDADLVVLKQSLPSGPQRVMLEVEVTDVDQQAVTGRASTRIEAADHYVGVHASTTFAGVGETVDVDVVAVSTDGKPAINQAIVVRWIERKWTTRRVASAGGGMTWESERHDKIIDERRLTSALTAQRTSFSPRSAGLYWVEVEGKDKRGRVVRARESVWVWGGGASWREDDEGHLEIIAAKATLKVGDVARYIVQSPFETAQALITVEANGIVWRDTRVLTGTAPLIEIPVSDAMMPNAFVSVVLLGVPKNATTPEVRMGYAPMQVDTSARRLDVVVTPDVARHRPGETVSVKLDVRDIDGNPSAAHVTFMAVDEGVLSLTGYRTPDPLAAFYKERSLAISTSEARRSMWSRLVADDGMKSDWGGGGESGEATNYRSAFATTAAFVPDVVVGSGGQAEVSFTLPDNLTTFRLMAVAASEDGRFGHGQAALEVSKPLLVRPGLPRFLSVGDRFDARAVVQALEVEHAGEVTVEFSVSGPVVIDGGATQLISASAKATAVTFAARATEPGVATIAFKVVSRAGVSDAVQVDVPVVWPAAKRTANTSGVVAASAQRESTTLKIPDWVRDDVGGITVTLTSTRLGELLPGLDYLLKYPYGCVEQTTGGTLPLLALSELQSGFELPGMTKDQVRVRAQAGLDRLRTMQTWSGGLSYWPGETTPHPWGSVYAGMALVRASKMPGLDVPAASIERLTSYLRDILKDQAAVARAEWHSEIDVVKPFAAWVLALAGTPEPAFNAAMFAGRAALPDFAKLLLALAIAESHGDMAMAEMLIDEVLATVRVDGETAVLERTNDHYWYSTMDSDVRSLALLALALQAVRPEDPMIAKVQAGLLAARSGGHWISTQENAFAVLALAKTFLASERPDARFRAKVEVDGQVWLDEAMRGDDSAPKTLQLPMYLAKKASGKQIVVTREGDSAPMYFSLAFEYAPKEIPRAALSQGFGIARRYRIADGPRAGQSIEEVHAGDTVQVDILVEAPELRRYVAVDDPLPAGLEPVTLDFATTRAALGALPEDDPRWRVANYGYVFNHSEQRDDRVVLFSDVMPAGKHRFTYLARATTAGAFLAPAARVHEMYHPEVFAQSQAMDVTIR